MSDESDVTQSPSLLREIIESAPVALVMTSSDGRIVLMNAEAQALFGYNSADLAHTTLADLLPESGSAHRKDGSQFPIELNRKHIYANGRQFLLSAITNLTERRLLESRFRATVESAPTAMVMTDRTGHIVLVNAETEKLFGYSRTELINSPIESLVPARFRPNHPHLRDGFVHAPEARRMGAGRDLFAIRKDGSEFPVEIGLNPVQTAEGLFVLSAIVDITERKRNARQLESALAEKTVLLNEIHHRVKNNLQIISGLLQLQAGQAQLPALRDLLAQSQSRVQSMAIIHELLYEGREFSRIRLDIYFLRLANLLWTTYLSKGDDVVCSPELDPVMLDLNRAIPAGLLVNELLTNSLKHANASTVTLSLRQIPGTPTVCASISDDGLGLPPGFNLEQTQTLGLTLATQLASQIGAELTIVPVPRGVCFQWQFDIHPEEPK